MVRQPTSPSTHVSTLRDYLQVVRRRKWIVIEAIVLVPLAALAFSLTQKAQYEANAKVLVSTQDLGAQLTGTQQAPSNNQNELQTQAELARVPAVARNAIAALGLKMSPEAFLRATSASASTTSNIITFTAAGGDPGLAARMASGYARAYVHYRFAAETAPIEAARTGLQKRISAAPDGALRNALIEKEQTLAEMAALMTNDASVVKTADGAAQTAPKTKRNTILGVLLGIMLGIGLAFLREALDTRVRSADTISERLELPLLARLPKPAKKLRDLAHLAMVDEPDGIDAEAFRMLRTNIEFASLDKGVRSIMVTSATEQEGKSTTIANLAVAFAKAGHHVVLVDLDLRRPFIDRFFDLEGKPGITQVAIGATALGDAIVRIPILRDDAMGLPASRRNQNGHGGKSRSTLGALDVLPAGPIPPDPGEFVGARRLTEIITHLSNHCDLVLIDAPPLFHVGDALVLSATVDAVMTVTRLDVLRRPMLTELHRLLASMPARKLGFVVTGAEAEEGYGYGYGYERSYYARSHEREEAGAT